MTDASRAVEVWRRLAGLFGGDALSRKFGDTPPPEWISMISRVKDYELDRGLRRLTNSGKAHVPTLPEFMRLCREVRNDEFPDEHKPAPISHQIDGPKADAWDVMANNHLMGHITRQGKIGIFYACEQTIRGERHIATQGPSRESRDLTKPLIQAKHVWAEMMRDAYDTKTIPNDHGQAWWDELIEQADAVVLEIRSGKLAA